jgi:hypothetical protein
MRSASSRRLPASTAQRPHPTERRRGDQANGQNGADQMLQSIERACHRSARIADSGALAAPSTAITLMEDGFGRYGLLVASEGLVGGLLNTLPPVVGWLQIDLTTCRVLVVVWLERGPPPRLSSGLPTAATRWETGQGGSE